ncbi:MAG: hypothetical protein ACI8RD_011623 [Bacillariaceae sp.]|jgi:hypothetical protein
MKSRRDIYVIGKIIILKEKRQGKSQKKRIYNDELGR